jgi:hypothetical protein
VVFQKHLYYEKTLHNNSHVETTSRMEYV